MAGKKQTYNVPHKLISNNNAGFNLYIKKSTAELIGLTGDYVEKNDINVEVIAGGTLKDSKLTITFKGGE